MLTNEGTIAPGGRGVVEQTLLGDQFVQTQTGTFAVDIDGQAGTSDQIVVSDTARLAGVVTVNVTSLPAIAAESYIILTAANGVTNNGLGVSASPALHATLMFPDPNTVELGIAVDFNASGSQSQRNVGRRTISMRCSSPASGGRNARAARAAQYGRAARTTRRRSISCCPTIYLDGQIAALQANLAFCERDC